jgi:hypothetical protein
MTRLFTCLPASALAVAGSFIIATGALASPQSIAELKFKAQESQSNRISDKPPLFGDYLASGDGSGSGALSGRIKWDLYEDHSRNARHPAWFRGILERDGHSYPFEIIGVSILDPKNSARWQISGAITFEDIKLLGTSHAPITGTFEASTSSARYTVWVDSKSR